MENMSNWIREAKKLGINLSMLHQDKEKMYEELQQLKLPHPKTYNIAAEQIKSKEVQNLFQKNAYFCRLIPKDKNAIRPYHLKIKTQEEFLHFCMQYELSEYKIQLVEKGNITHSGVIVIKNKKGIIELVRGDGPDITHGHKIPVTADVKEGIYYRNEVDEREKNIIKEALLMIGWQKNFIEGYFEFEVWNNDKILFRNYQPPESAWANIDKM